LRLTAASSPVLKGERTLSLRVDPPVAARRRERNAREPAVAVDLPGDAMARFESLRAWRAETARVQNVPAYVIFHDRTLREIALAQPADLDGLAGIGGVGAGKLERYGEALLRQLAQADAA
jgi:ATP-dependent DNA helicase RecQ